MTNRKKKIKQLISTLILMFVLMNVIAIFHGYKLTHFVDRKIEKTKEPKKLTETQKILTLIFGVSNPRPTNEKNPSAAYTTITLHSNKKISCWKINAANPKGTVILFHGFGGQKLSLLDKAAVFSQQGFNTFLVDFMGSGGSEGNQTTIGFLEAQQVKSCYDFLSKTGEKNIFHFGTSMGSVAIVKAINDFKIKPKGIIIECPFGSMYTTACARFKTIDAPTFPMAGLLVFWGGLQNGFWAFGHNPTKYAKKITCPTLLLYGQQDEKVSKEEIAEIFANLAGQKELKIYKNAGHENYLTKYKEQWTQDVNKFITAK